jgi:hypothetical protein
MTRPSLLAALLLLSPLAARAEHRLLFVGGAGGDESPPTLTRLEQHLKDLDPKHTVVVFTGNYARAELPDEDAPGRTAIERQVMAHVNATRDFAGRGGAVYFLPGDRDFAAGGAKAVKRLRKFLNHAYPGKHDVMPVSACGEPVEIELGDTLGLLLLNSQWWMQDWDLDPASNQGCQLKTREALTDPLRGALNVDRRRRLVIATHHPLLSYGAYGGDFTWQQHITPAPIVGTVEILARQAGLVPQYYNHPRFRAWVDLVLTEAARYGQSVFVSGHDANLQFLTVDKQLQVISGSSGTTADPVNTATGSDFTAAQPGWAELDFDGEGGGTARIVSGADEAELFKTQIPDLKPFKQMGPPSPMPQGPVMSTYARSSPPPLGGLSRWFIGSLYGDAYGLKLPFEVLDLRTEQGGLTPEKSGGSLQTNALRLTDPQGGQWTLRPTGKDSSRLMSSDSEDHPLDRAFTGLHPEGALAAPRFAEAVGVLHTTPRMMYLPDQEALGKYRGYLGDQVVLLERRANEPKEGELPEEIAGKRTAAGPTKYRSTDEMFEKQMKSPATHRVDPEAMLRARLLDIFMGDWDRHEDQWRWAERPNGDGTFTFLPIPRDRDQVFSNYDGFMMAVARTGSSQARKLHAFTPDYPRLRWLDYNARNMDPVLLNGISRERWMQIAAAMKTELSDAVIDEAMSTWHPDAYALDGEKIKTMLKARRDQLEVAAAELFDDVNLNAEVVGSEGDDRFDLYFREDKTLRLTVRTKDQGEPWFDRVYEPAHTDELWIYALEGDDVLRVHGEPNRKIEIRFVGGEGDDLVTAPKEPGRGEGIVSARAIDLYDFPNGARIDKSIDVADRRSMLPQLNQYDRFENHEPSALTFVPGLRVDHDVGAELGADLLYVAPGFKKTPWGSRQLISARFSTADLGASLAWQGSFPDSVEVLDQDVLLKVDAPTTTRNFFGYTNRFVDPGVPLDYFRVRQARYEGRYGLSYAYGGDRTRVGVQGLALAVDTEATPGRYVSLSDQTRDALGMHAFIGARIFAQTQTFDSLTLPTRGVGASLSIESRYDLVRGRQFSSTYKAAAAAAIPFGRQHKVVLQSRVSLEGIVGDHAFYFEPTLGDIELRAYHSQQLAGEIAFAQTTDLRFELLRLTSVPGSGGVIVSVDHGRVFGPSINSDLWHLSAGGSLYLSIMDVMGFSLGYYRGIDGGSTVRFMLGPMFIPNVL